MHCIDLRSTDPFFNLAIEELLLRQSEEEYLILSTNDPSVIIGKHQSAHMEVDTGFLHKNQIPVLRRISGGGTVYHDRGNLNFSFISNSETGRQINFRKYVQPVIDFLSASGIVAEFGGKNDLKVGGFKISGNAEHIHGNRVLHHGTLLFSASLEMMRNTIRSDKSGYSSRAIQSNPSSVMNLNEKLDCYRDISEFKSDMMNFFLKYFTGSAPYELTFTEMKEAQSVADKKYRSWEWIWGYGPDYTFGKSFEINNEFHTCRLFVKDGIIAGCAIEGSEMLKGIAVSLIGCRHMVGDIYNIFRSSGINIIEEDIYNFF